AAVPADPTRASRDQHVQVREARARPTRLRPDGHDRRHLLQRPRARRIRAARCRAVRAHSQRAHPAMTGRQHHGERMRPETLAIHGGYEIDPTTKSVAVPIYQTVAYAFDSADHGAALFNLEAEGFRYTRISNPTTAVLERRVALLENGCEALAVSSG